jgi:hypothetical protein
VRFIRFKTLAVAPALFLSISLSEMLTLYIYFSSFLLCNNFRTYDEHLIHLLPPCCGALSQSVLKAMKKRMGKITSHRDYDTSAILEI